VNYDFPCDTELTYELLEKDRMTVLNHLGTKGWQVVSEVVTRYIPEMNKLLMVAEEMQITIQREVSDSS